MKERERAVEAVGMDGCLMAILEGALIPLQMKPGFYTQSVMFWKKIMVMFLSFISLLHST